MTHRLLLVTAVFAVSLLPVWNSGCDEGNPIDARPDAGIVQDLGEDTPPDGGAFICIPSTSGLIDLPADDAIHPEEPFEWWYWTGHLQAADGRWFGFRQTFFYVVLPGSHVRIQAGHHALTDIDAATFHHALHTGFGELTPTPDGFSFEYGELTGSGGCGFDQIHARTDDTELDLTLTPAKTPTIHHGDGRIDYPVGGYSYYYSRERLTAEGTVRIRDEDLEVSGVAWFDHQYGDLFPVLEAGWTWYALILDDGREIMFYTIELAGGDEFRTGSLTQPDGQSEELDADHIAITPTGTWTSPQSGQTYPHGWDVEIRDISMTITPVLDAQEMPNGSGGYYWEGAAIVRGDATGRAHVEVTP